MKERDHMFAKHPKTRFIAAHFAWYGNDLARAAKLLDTLPNVTLEVAAVLYEFGRQPYAATQFFTKYQDRVMFGKDTYETSDTRTTGASSRPTTSTSTTTAPITHSGSCTGWDCRTRC